MQVIHIGALAFLGLCLILNTTVIHRDIKRLEHLIDRRERENNNESPQVSQKRCG